MANRACGIGGGRSPAGDDGAFPNQLSSVNPDAVATLRAQESRGQRELSCDVAGRATRRVDEEVETLPLMGAYGDVVLTALTGSGSQFLR